MYTLEGNGDWLFTAVPVVIGLIFAVALIGIIVNGFRGLSQWNKNEHSPRLSVPASVKVKRINVTRHNQSYDENTYSNSSSTTYFVTFEFESGDRSEFRVPGKEYGLMAEGDIGTLTFQGTRYIAFSRGKPTELS